MSILPAYDVLKKSQVSDFQNGEALTGVLRSIFLATIQKSTQRGIYFVVWELPIFDQMCTVGAIEEVP